MGDITGFLKYKRKETEYRPVEERVRDFKPVEIELRDEELHRQAARCMNCGIPFCHGCGCPLFNLIPEFNDLAHAGRWKEALDILLSTSNFPEITARVCPAPCEPACTLAINDDPVSIRQIEIALIDAGFEKGLIKPRPPERRFRERVAVIGSGPAGLSAADSLNRAGYPVTVFERDRKPGGLLRYGIPDFKLDKAILDRRIALMEAEGVRFETGVTVGEDVSHKYLLDRFDAICLAGGARQPRDLPIPGRELRGIHFAMDFLKIHNQRVSGEPLASERIIDAAGKSVVVIGGGDTGSDCIGTSVRAGARRILQLEILPRPPDQRPDSSPWPVWPNVLRTSSSHKEGGERRWSAMTKEFLGADGQVNALRCAEVEWVTDAAGRRIPREKPGSEFMVEADLVLLAMGFVGPGPNRLVDLLGIARDECGNIKTDARHMTNVPGVFAAGDMSRGQSLVVRAGYDGRLAAEGIHEWFK